MANALTNLPSITSDALKSMLASMAQTRPDIHAAVASECERVARVAPGGNVRRVRSAVLYSSGGLTTDAGGVVTQRTIPLYRVPEGSADPVLGVLDGAFTNLQSAGKVETSLGFVALAQFFELGIVTPPAGGPPTAEELNAFFAILGARISANLQLAAGDIQRFGAVGLYPAPTQGYRVTSDAAAAPVATLSPQSVPWDGIYRFSPPLELRPGSSVLLNANVPPGLPGIPSMGSGVFFLRHTFAGLEVADVPG